jgi:sporulation protein YlmC with PRC-barrel domain
MRGERMEIEYGARVVDKSGKLLGKVDKVILDKWSGEMTRFKVNTGKDKVELFISPEDVAEAAPDEVKLKMAMDEPQPRMGVEYGARVVDKNDKFIGKVNYIAKDAWTGENGKFKISTGKVEDDLMVSPEDVLEVTPTSVKLKISHDDLRQQQ